MVFFADSAEESVKFLSLLFNRSLMKILLQPSGLETSALLGPKSRIKLSVNFSTKRLDDMVADSKDGAMSW